MIIKNNIDYTRRDDLETEDTSVIIIDINAGFKYRIINVYRQFNPPNNQNQSEHFAAQLHIIKNSLENLNGRNPIILGDFNLDDKKRYCTSYRNKHLFEQLITLTDEKNLIQLLKDATWQRIINNDLKDSILDHLYVMNRTLIHDIVLKLPSLVITN